jgi:hypothetical protein
MNERIKEVVKQIKHKFAKFIGTLQALVWETDCTGDCNQGRNCNCYKK